MQASGKERVHVPTVFIFPIALTIVHADVKKKIILVIVMNVK